MLLIKLFMVVAAGLTVGSMARADLNQAIRGCISQADQNLHKSRTSGTSDSTVGIVCYGEWARYLFSQVQHYGDQSEIQKDDEHNTFVTRYFGNLPVPSQCVHVIQDAYGNAVGTYRCVLQIDFNDAVTKAL